MKNPLNPSSFDGRRAARIRAAGLLFGVVFCCLGALAIGGAAAGAEGDNPPAAKKQAGEPRQAKTLKQTTNPPEVKTDQPAAPPAGKPAPNPAAKSTAESANKPPGGPTTSPNPNPAASPDEAAKASDRFWKAHIQPMLSAHCLDCHGDKKKRNDLDLRTVASILKGGKSGPAVIPGRPDRSPMLQMTHEEAETRMPPKGKALTEDQRGILKTWIEKLPGGTDPDSAQAPGGPDGAHGAEKPTGPGTGDAQWVKAGADLLAKPTGFMPPAGTPPTQAIDQMLEKGWKDRAIQPAADASDASFVRRIYLDLIGRIPTQAEAETFLKDTRADRRVKLVDQLLAHPHFARHMRDTFNASLMGRTGADKERERNSAGWLAYLERSFAANQPWDKTVRQVLLARPQDEREKAADWFIYERNNKHQDIAEAVSQSFFGVQIQCAQCHNHPLASEIKQAHYWGLVAIFSRSSNVNTPGGPAVAESAVGGYLKFSDLKGVTSQAALTFLQGPVIQEPPPPADGKENDGADKYVVPPSPAASGGKGGKGKGPGKTNGPAATPKHSRRAEFVEKVVTGNPLIARAFVNRAWAMMMGRGIVHPVDKMDSKHPPSHPELLHWLAEDFRTSGYDVKRLIRAIVLSRAYQLQSVPPGKNTPVEAFAYSIEKPLIAEAYYRSLLVTTTGGAAEAEDEGMLDAFRSVFPDVLPEENVSTLKQALFLTNNARFHGLLKQTPGSIVERVLSAATPEDQTRQAFALVMGRAPNAGEITEVGKYLANRSDRPVDAAKQVIWALLTSPEFRFNH